MSLHNSSDYLFLKNFFKSKYKCNSSPIFQFCSFTKSNIKSKKPVTQSEVDAMYINNGQITSLGLQIRDRISNEEVNDYIKSIVKFYDMIILSDYFEESMVLLSEKLNWPMSKLIYIKQNESKSGSKIRTIAKSIKSDSAVFADYKKWNFADELLYETVNKTFWENFNNLDKSLVNRKTTEYRKLLKEVETDCPLIEDTTSKKVAKGGTPYVVKLLTQEARKDYCYHMNRNDLDFTRILRRGVLTQFSAIQ